jgi:hypothetical protein
MGPQLDRQRVMEPGLDEDGIVALRLLREGTDLFEIGVAKIAQFHPIDFFGFGHAVESAERINFSARAA